jgi:hypothetical protein
VPSACEAQAGRAGLLVQVAAVPPAVALLLAARLKTADCQPISAPALKVEFQ